MPENELDETPTPHHRYTLVLWYGGVKKYMGYIDEAPVCSSGCCSCRKELLLHEREASVEVYLLFPH
jgi:hypothetical protein